MTLIRSKPVYIKIYFNKIEITDLRTGESISRNATQKFSLPRIVLAEFNVLDSLIRTTLKELIKTKFAFQENYNVLIQQVEKAEGGLTETEKRALRDLGELAGGRKIILLHHTRRLSYEEALIELNSGK